MSKKIIVAPLNWGLGHASRCVPIIKSLLKNNFTPIIASDGNALAFLQQEFPDLETLQLPSYHIFYGKNLKLNLLFKAITISKAIKKEQKIIKEFVLKNTNVIGIISDNRFGVRSTKVTSVYITHQLNVLSGFTTFLTSKIHQKIIKRFDQCWIPDQEGSKFSGKLSLTNKKLNQKYIGILSRFKKENILKTIDVLVVLSGPEPNRSFLEKKIQAELINYKGNVVLVQGKVENKQKIVKNKSIKIYNFMLSKELQNAINSSKFIISRSGYSSIMDLITLEKNALLIPTKNQSEQEYLAKYLENLEYFFFIKEKDFKKQKCVVKKVPIKNKYIKKEFDSALFGFFKRKRKL